VAAPAPAATTPATATATVGFGGFTLGLPISTGGEESFTRIGRLTIPFRAGDRSLGAYWMAGYAGGLFVPFRDATNGAETYGAGRLLDTAKSADLARAPHRQPGARLQLHVPPVVRLRPEVVMPLAPPRTVSTSRSRPAAAGVSRGSDIQSRSS
jgi:hypothetical protein